MHWNHTKLNNLPIESRGKKGIYVAIYLFFYLFAFKIKEKSKILLKYYWIINLFAEIILASLKCIELVFFITKYQV